MTTALHKFDTSREAKLSTFAYPSIRNALLRTIMNDHRLVRIPETTQARMRDMQKVVEAFSNKHGRCEALLALAEPPPPPPPNFSPPNHSRNRPPTHASYLQMPRCELRSQFMMAVQKASNALSDKYNRYAALLADHNPQQAPPPPSPRGGSLQGITVANAQMLVGPAALRRCTERCQRLLQQAWHMWRLRLLISI